MKVEEASLWVLPVVVVPDKNDIRLCGDIRQANQAVFVKGTRYPPFKKCFHHSTLYSKLDIKLVYHKLVLDPESRQITTFMIHKGMYRNKGLMFGKCITKLYRYWMDVMVFRIFLMTS